MMKMTAITSYPAGQFTESIRDTAYSLFSTMMDKKQYSGMITIAAFMDEAKIKLTKEDAIESYVQAFLSTAIIFEASDNGVNVNRFFPLFNLSQYNASERTIGVQINYALIEISKTANVTMKSQTKH